MVKVSFDTLLYIESCGDYIKLHTNKEVLITRETISAVAQKLPEKLFVRVHRSFIVSLSKIDSFTNEQIIISRTSIPISRSYRDLISQRLNDIQ